MGIKVKYRIEDVEKITNQFFENMLYSIYETLKLAALEVVKDAKLTETYADQTGNLRSSIGFVIYYDGKKVSDEGSDGGFGGGALIPNKDGKLGDGKDGRSIGENVAEELAAEYTKGFVVVIVAGMDYAAYVEAKGYDVITGSSYLLAPYFEQHLKYLKNQTGINFIKD